MTKDELKVYLSKQIDMMDDTELVELSDFLQNKSEGERVAEELIVIKGEFKKLTKLVTQMQAHLEMQGSNKIESQLKPLIQFYTFLQNSKEALLTMPENTLFGLSKFNKAFGAFENGFLTIDMLYKDILESVELELSTKVGDVFDADFHEVVDVVKDKDREDGTIVEVLEEGFLYKKALLNYAKVKVNRWM